MENKIIFFKKNYFVAGNNVVLLASTGAGPLKKKSPSICLPFQPDPPGDFLKLFFVDKNRFSILTSTFVRSICDNIFGERKTAASSFSVFCCLAMVSINEETI